MTTNTPQQPRIRRPAVVALAKRLKQSNPDWSEQKCLETAKLLVTQKTA